MIDRLERLSVVLQKKLTVNLFYRLIKFASL
jgi:hypothetical protein